MNPKLRTDAPLDSGSRSMTTTRNPLSAAARAHDRPMIPAPTTARSNVPETADGEPMIRIVKTPQGTLVNYKNMTDVWQASPPRQKHQVRNQDKLVL
jgi:hypothetical protein